MSRTAEDLLEFPRLREIVARRTTCAPGRRAVLALAPRQDEHALAAEFDLIREAVEYLRAGSELGFGALAVFFAAVVSLDVFFGAVFFPAGFDAGSRDGPAGWCR